MPIKKYKNLYVTALIVAVIGVFVLLRFGGYKLMGANTWINSLPYGPTARAYYESTRLDANGYPVIVFTDAINNDLKVVHCNDANCSGGDESIQTPDAIAGTTPCLQLDANGYPVIAYTNSGSDTLKLMHCNDVNCAGGDEIIVTIATSIGYVAMGYPSLVLDSAGNPLVNYRRQSSGSKVTIAKCSDANCGGKTTITVETLYAYNSYILLDSQDRPVVAYSKNTGELRLTHCGDTTCSSGNSSVTITTEEWGGNGYLSMKLDANGFPVISFAPNGATGPKVAHCGNANCSAGNSIVTLTDTSSAGIGVYSTIALDGSGNPMVAYGSDLNSTTRFARCADANCTSFSAKTLPNRTDRTPSMVLDANYNPIIVYTTSSDYKLTLLHCSDPDCNSSSSSNPAASFIPAAAGTDASLALDANGYPVIAAVDYGGANGNDLRIMHCNDWYCSGANETFSPANIDGSAWPSINSYWPSIALDANGYPVVSFYVDSGGDGGAVKLLHCNDPNCDGAGENLSTVTTIFTENMGSVYGGLISRVTSLALDANGYPVIAFADQQEWRLYLAHCNDANCSGSNETINTIGFGLVPSLALDINGYPVISYISLGVSLTHCNDANCSGSNESTVTVDAMTFSGTDVCNSMVLDANGYPVISYFDHVNKDLKLTRCRDVNCIEKSTMTLDSSGDVGKHNSITLDSSGYPMISYQGSSVSVLKFIRCEDADCASFSPETVYTDSNGNTAGEYSSIKTKGGGVFIAYKGDGLRVSTAVISLPTSAVAADIAAQPNAGAATVNISGSFNTETPNTNQYYIAINSGDYGNVTNGPSNTANPGAVSVAAGKTLDGDDIISKVKIVHIDDGGNQVTNENLTPVNAYKYVLPYNATLVQVSATSNTYNLKLQPNSAEASTVQYAIGVSLSGFSQNDIQYIQSSGLLSAVPYWATYADWGGTSGFVIKEAIGSSNSFGVKARNPHGPTNAETAWHSIQSPQFGNIGGGGGSGSGGSGGGGGGASSASTPVVVTPSRPSAISQPAYTPSENQQSSSGRAEALVDLDKLKALTKANIIKAVNLMIDSKTYVVSASKKYWPSRPVNAAFATKLIMAISDRCCSREGKYPGYKTIRELAVKFGFIPANLQRSAKLTREDFYGLLLKVLGVKLEKGTVKALREECSDIENASVKTARIFFTAYKYGLVSKYKGNACRLHMKFSRAEAAKWVVRALKAKAKLKK